VERDGDTTGRWTDGDAELPFIDTAAVIEVLIGDTLLYAASPPEPIEAELAPTLVLRAG
jgi:hypothetical protein